MLKVVASGCLLLGSIGYAICLCRDGKSRITFMRTYGYCISFIREQIRYGALPFTQIFLELSEKVENPFQSIFLEISKKIQFITGEELEEAWREEFAKVLDSLQIQKEQKELILSFPTYLYSHDRTGQSEKIEIYEKKLNEMIEQQKKEDKNKNKMTISLGIATGFFAVLILI